MPTPTEDERNNETGRSQANAARAGSLGGGGAGGGTPRNCWNCFTDASRGVQLAGCGTLL
jgi:hypothetical protein